MYASWAANHFVEAPETAHTCTGRYVCREFYLEHNNIILMLTHISCLPGYLSYRWTSLVSWNNSCIWILALCWDIHSLADSKRGHPLVRNSILMLYMESTPAASPVKLLRSPFFPTKTVCRPYTRPPWSWSLLNQTLTTCTRGSVVQCLQLLTYLFTRVFQPRTDIKWNSCTTPICRPFAQTFPPLSSLLRFHVFISCA